MAASWDNATSSPAVKFEHSPAESFLSAPGEMYPSLFEAASTPANTMNPLDIMTPGSFEDDDVVDLSQEVSTPAPSDGKKQTKKRKSWGQVLPEPKTNLPPRKRAKTEDEKEQRRVERVLRNRRAAQSSRERKRLEVEALEIRNQELEAELLRVSKANYILVEELNNLRRSSGVVSRTSATLPTPVSFTPELFSSHDGHSLLDQTKSSILDELLKSTSTHTTVNPSSLSPELAPVADEAMSKDAEASTLEGSAATAAVTVASPDVTQQPAALLCPPGLQCQSSDAAPPSALATAASSSLQLPPQLLQLLSSQLQLLMTSTSAALSICRRPLTQIAMSSKAGFSLPPSPRILSTIIWLVTMSRRPRTQSSTRSSRRQAHRQSTSTPSTSTTSLMKLQPLPLTTATHPASRASAGLHRAASQPTPRHRRSSPPSSTLRLTTLRKILTSSPHLARPLSDATLEVLRLVSPSEARSRSHRSSAGRQGKADEKSEAGYPKVFPSVLANAADQLGVGERWRRSGSALPSREVLLTLLWVLRVEEQKRSGLQRRTRL